MPGTQTVERPMIVEGRTITTIEEMLDFCLAAVARTGLKPSAIPLHIAQAKVYHVSVSSAG